jgi:hypothetical protein
MENIIKGAVVVNEFVRRQTKESPFSYYGGPIEDVAEEAERLMAEHPSSVKPGYKDGVVLVRLSNGTGFHSGVVDLNEMHSGISSPVDTDPKGEFEFVTSFQARREGEEKFVEVKAKGPKAPAKVVDLVLYRRDVLKENERSPALPERHAAEDKFAEWELISINARATEEEEPMTPVAMMRNMLELPGGTKATYTAEDFCKSVHYWSSRVMSA